MKTTDRVLYSINVEDAQKVAQQKLGRELSAAEIAIVEEHLGDQLDWFGAIATVLEQHLVSHEIAT